MNLKDCRVCLNCWILILRLVRELHLDNLHQRDFSLYPFHAVLGSGQLTATHPRYSGGTDRKDRCESDAGGRSEALLPPATASLTQRVRRFGFDLPPENQSMSEMGFPANFMTEIHQKPVPAGFVF